MAGQNWRVALKHHGPMLLFAIVVALAGMIVLVLQAFAQEVDANMEDVNSVPVKMIMWSSIIGFFLPLAIAIPKRKDWPSWLKGLFAFVCCLATAAGTAYWSGDLTKFKDYATAALFVTFSALGSYKLLWGRESAGVADKITDATNPGYPPEQVVVVQNPPPPVA